MREVDALEGFEVVSKRHGESVDVGAKVTVLVAIETDAGVVFGRGFSIPNQERVADFTGLCAQG